MFGRRSDRVGAGLPKPGLWVIPIFVALLVPVAVGSSPVLLPSVFAASGTATSQAEVPQFTMTRVKILPAAGSPRPASGKEAALPWAGSSVSAVITGAGQVLVGVRGTACKGSAEIEGFVDGKSVGRTQVVDSTQYGPRRLGISLAQGNHTVKVVSVSDAMVPGVCDRNAFVSSISIAPVAPPMPPVEPGAGNTGVPAGTPLTVHQGDLTVTTDGTVIDAMDIRGYVYVKANRVTITRSLIRGGSDVNTSHALVANWWGNTGLLVQDSTLKADVTSLHLDGISGGGYTARRLNVSAVVDTAKVIGSNVTIENSWMHGTAYSDRDPNQSDGKTHDDNVQIEGGSNIVIRGNLFENSHNAAIMVTQNYAATANVMIQANHLRGGACTVNVSQQGVNRPILGMAITGNRFGPGWYGTTCPIRVPTSSPVSISANVWEPSMAAANANRY